jgi:alpha,alpha-trehalose phosphorylase
MSVDDVDGDDCGWVVVEDGLDLDRLGWSESVFSLANGHIGLRGNLDEGEPADTPGTYLNSVFEYRPLPIAEPGYGLPESGQTVVNVTNPKVLRILVDDEPFDVRYGTLRSHHRRLDLRRGVLEREVEWESPARQAVRLRSTRLVSYAQRAIVAIRLVIEPVGESARIVVQSELVGGEPQPRPDVADPRVAAALDAPFVCLDHSSRGDVVALVHRTRRSGIGVAAAMTHQVTAPGRYDVNSDSSEDLGRTTITASLDVGERLEIVKYAAYGWSTQRTQHALRDQVAAAIEAAHHTGWEGLLAEQRHALDSFWRRADIEVEGPEGLQTAVRFCLFQAYQSAVRAESRPIAAKGLSGSGYDGHTFWDSEGFVVPVLSHLLPDAAADVLRWRRSTLDFARERAAALRLDGAAIAWRTIRGGECSGYWPAGTAAFHITGAVAGAARRHVEVTGDREFEASVAVELLVAAARLWRSLGHFELGGDFRIDGITGPDEYSAVVDNDVYTNLLAASNLRAAADAVERHPVEAERHGVDSDEVASWRAAADAMCVPYDERLGVHQQAEGFTDHERWPFDRTGPEEYPLLRNHPYFDLYRKQVVKQADLVLALHRFPDRFDDEQVRRDFDHYEQITVRDSSISAISQAVVAARVGYVDRAEGYLHELALVDLDELHGNTRDGLHIAASAGVWSAVVEGLGGLHAWAPPSFRPVGPRGLGRLAFRVPCEQGTVHVDLRPDRVGYRLAEGTPLVIRNEDEELEVGRETTWRPVRQGRPDPAPAPPPGREVPLAPAHPRGWTGRRSDLGVRGG